MKDINIDEKEKKKKITISIVFGVILLALVGITYAYFFFVKNIGIGEVKSGKLSLSFTNGTDELILDKAVPIYEEEIDEKASYTTFSIHNTGTLDMYTEIYFKDMTIPDALKTVDFKWILEQSDTNNFNNATEINRGDFSDADASKNKNLIQGLQINASTTKYFRVKIWVQETGLEQNGLNGTTFSGKIGATGYVRSTPNPPKLADGMIPVTYNESTDNWVKADTSKEWYNYYKQKWANAVTVTETNRTTYMNATPGTTISMDDINTMWVWIPRYKYKIASYNGVNYGGGVTNPPKIDVIFEGGTATTGVTEAVYRNGITSGGNNTNYYTHPAFRNGSKVYNENPYDIGGFDKELTGIWVGKFETGTDNETCNTTSNKTNCKNVDPIIKPDVKSLVYQDVSTQFLTSLKITGGTMNSSTGKVTFSGNEKYGLTKNTDTHMMKNTEWGMVAILSQSQYGKMGNKDYKGANKEIYINNSGSGITSYTGRSGGAPGGSTPINETYTDQTSTTQYNSYGFYTYDDYLLNYDTNTKGSKVKGKGTGTSTTGTIYGIYDMSGGSDECTFGNWNGYSGHSLPSYNSGFNGPLYDGTTKTDGMSFPEEKYYDKYTKGDGIDRTMTKEKAILGDAIWETKTWYQDYSSFLVTSHPFFSRGSLYAGYYSEGTNAGIFSVSQNEGDSGTGTSFRLTLIP